MKKRFVTHSSAQTKNLAKKIARSFKGNEVLGLVGELGSGKTQFVKGLAEYFGIKQTITSPTFVLIKIYNIKKERTRQCRVPTKLIHIDCYRLNSPEELLAIGLQEFLDNKNNLVIIEWAEKIKKILPKNTIWIKFELGKKEKQRIISFLDY